MESSQNNSLSIPISIIVAGIIIAAAVYLTGSGPSEKVVVNKEDSVEGKDKSVIKGVEASEHIRGNPNAPVKIVEYSDLECPFCQRFHVTMNQIMDEYNESGDVAWVYRHLPLESIHPEATPAALASECIAKKAGNDAFWKFVDFLFENQSQLGLALYQSEAEKYGISKEELDECALSAEIQNAVFSDAEDAANAGAQGTPFSVVVSPKGRLTPISGALPYASVKQVVEAALSEL